ncbi:MAG: iron-containing alcohol dehydrogenase [Syntrophaceae bacterium]|nr:iron-containing alcohol dehydrogenase [Syntrophaceae bacterium]
MKMHSSYDYEFLNYPKIISGKCSLENIPAELAGYDAQKPLVIVRKSLGKNGALIKKFIRAFADSMVIIGAIYDEVEDYAGISRAREAALLFKDRGCDSLIALGSGAAVDLAKAVNVLVSEKADNFSAYYEEKSISGILKPLIVVPAGLANGREASNNLIIDNREIKSDFLYPDVMVIDHRVAAGCSAADVAESAAIAFAQAFHSFVGNSGNSMVAALAHPALSYLSQYLERGMKKPQNKEASVALVNASVMASIAYANAKPGITNLLAEELARATGISSGIFMGILLPAVIDFLVKDKIKISDEFLLAAGSLDAYAAVAANERGQKGLETAKKLVGVFSRVLPVSLNELKVQKYILAEIARDAAQKSEGFFPAVDCAEILEASWEKTLTK